ncbi:hypothetical protein REPUB_Repub08aG0097000 [Reevesia pubescens]
MSMLLHVHVGHGILLVSHVHMEYVLYCLEKRKLKTMLYMHIRKRSMRNYIV